MVTTSNQPTTAPLPHQLRNRDRDRLAAYKKALDFFNGNQWPGVPSGSRLRRLTVNYVRAIVYKTSSYVMQGAAVSVHPDSEHPDALQAAAAAEAAIAEFSDANALARLDSVSEVDTAVLGDGAYKVTWDPLEQRVNITSPDVATIFPWPHPTDPTRFIRVAQRYELPARDAFQLTGRAPNNDPTMVTEDWTDTTYDIYIDDTAPAAATFPNPYGFIPFAIYPNQQLPKRWNGESDITPLIEIATELNSEYSRISNILELSGNPITILENIDESSNIESYPGAVWNIPENARAYLLDMLQHGGIRLHLDYLEQITRALHALSETPRTAFGDNDRDIAGVALAIELQPLLQRVARKRRTRTDAYRTRTAYAFSLLDRFTGTNYLNAGDIIVNWEAPTPADTTRIIQDQDAMISAGVTSRRTAMATLGQQDPDSEWSRWMQEEAQIRNLDNKPQPA